MAFNFPLDLTFRGDRDYLHGTDIYEAISALPWQRETPPAISLTFHSQVCRQPDLVQVESPAHPWRDDLSFRGDVRIGLGDSAIHAVLLESSRPVSDRRACNEKAVSAHAMIDVGARLACLTDSVEGSAIEQVVFTNKKLHQQVLPQLGGKWLFARLESRQPLAFSTAGTLSLKLGQVLGNRFTRTEIRWDDEPVGTLFFSLSA